MLLIIINSQKAFTSISVVLLFFSKHFVGRKPFQRYNNIMCALAYAFAETPSQHQSLIKIATSFQWPRAQCHHWHSPRLTCDIWMGGGGEKTQHVWKMNAKQIENAMKGPRTEWVGDYCGEADIHRVSWCVVFLVGHCRGGQSEDTKTRHSMKNLATATCAWLKTHSGFSYTYNI